MVNMLKPKIMPPLLARRNMKTRVKIYLFPNDRSDDFKGIHFTCEAHLETIMRDIVKRTKLVRVSDFQAIADSLAVTTVPVIQKEVRIDVKKKLMRLAHSL
jgi:hypothetical protein